MRLSLNGPPMSSPPSPSYTVIQGLPYPPNRRSIANPSTPPPPPPPPPPPWPGKEEEEEDEEEEESEEEEEWWLSPSASCGNAWPKSVSLNLAHEVLDPLSPFVGGKDMPPPPPSPPPPLPMLCEWPLLLPPLPPLPPPSLLPFCARKRLRRSLNCDPSVFEPRAFVGPVAAIAPRSIDSFTGVNMSARTYGMAAPSTIEGMIR
jgi:hypothetical protein